MGEIEAQRATLLLLVFPGSFFFSAFYTEGLFLLLVAGAFYFFLAQRYLLVGLLGMLASLTRPTGVLLFGIFGAALVWHRLRGQRLPPAAMAIGLIPLGLGLYALLLYFHGQHPLSFATAQEYWGREAALPFTTLFITLSRVDWSFPRDMKGMQYLANVFCAIWFLCVGLLGLIRGLRARNGLELAQPLYVLAGVLVPLCSGSADSMVRYCSVLFPAFAMMAAGLRNSLAYYWVLYVFSILLTIYTLGFMNKFWVV
jgi:Gpi18-like mannosyltransferase